MVRSSRPKVFCKVIVLRNFANFTGKHLCQGLQLYQKRVSGTGIFMWILRNFYLRTLFFTEHLRWLLLICSKWQFDLLSVFIRKGRLCSFMLHFALVSRKRKFLNFSHISRNQNFFKDRWLKLNYTTFYYFQIVT